MPRQRIIRQWRRFAAEALELASKSEDEHERVLLHRIAKHYQELVKRYEGNGGGNDAAGR
jgi:hypothetical protein